MAIILSVLLTAAIFIMFRKEINLWIEENVDCED